VIPVDRKAMQALWHILNGADSNRAVAKAMGCSVSMATSYLHNLEHLNLISVGKFPPGHRSAGRWIAGTIKPTVKRVKL
jgi:hypothetical protein